MTVLFVIQDAADIVSTLQAASAPQLLSFQVFVSERRSDRGQVFVSSGADDFPIMRREALRKRFGSKLLSKNIDGSAAWKAVRGRKRPQDHARQTGK